MKFYALLDTNTNVIEFGINEIQMKNRQDNLTYVEVIPAFKPSYNFGNFVDETTPILINGIWTQQWEIKDKPVYQYFTELTQLKLDRTTVVFEAEIKEINSNRYTQSEIDSWERQQKEAELYQADNAAIVPLLASMATSRGITVDSLATKIITKVSEYQGIFGVSLGKKQKKEDEIQIIVDDAGTDQEKLDSMIAVEIESPISHVLD